jgi:predicted amidohydrolase
MRLLLTALRCGKGELEPNLLRHLALLREAGEAGCELAVFPEMSLTGYGDPAGRPGQLIGLHHPAVREIARATASTGVGACFGIAERGPDGLPYISQLVASGGEILGVQRKRHLGAGEEAFTAATGSTVFCLAGVTFGIAICAEAGFDPAFDDAAAAGASLVLLPSAPGLHGRRTDDASWQRGLDWWESAGLADARGHARRLGLWIALATQAGSTMDEDFPGLAAVVDPHGEVTARLPDWREGTLVADIPR